ncbi:unnamed protein product [Rodentolepis nana]|uniref:Glutaredoxin-1 n=1 Tax=Rodentolepis nana TaxID=102285 RepID=A0A0R3TMU4_RODNA|nr:unnamed protein product [Rodentolepis nana]
MGNLFKSGRSSEIENFVQEQIKSAHVVMFVKKTCPYCSDAIDILRSQYGPNFTENDMHVIDIAKRPDHEAIQDYLCKITGARTVPRIFIGQTSIGGCSDLDKLKKTGALAELLQQK